MDLHESLIQYLNQQLLQTMSNMDQMDLHELFFSVSNLEHIETMSNEAQHEPI